MRHTSFAVIDSTRIATIIARVATRMADNGDFIDAILLLEDALRNPYLERMHDALRTVLRRIEERYYA